MISPSGRCRTWEVQQRIGLWQCDGNFSKSFCLHEWNSEQVVCGVCLLLLRMPQKMDLDSRAIEPICSLTYLFAFSHAVHLSMEAHSVWLLPKKKGYTCCRERTLVTPGHHILSFVAIKGGHGLQDICIENIHTIIFQSGREIVVKEVKATQDKWW